MLTIVVLALLFGFGYLLHTSVNNSKEAWHRKIVIACNSPVYEKECSILLTK